MNKIISSFYQINIIMLKAIYSYLKKIDTNNCTAITMILCITTRNLRTTQ